MSTHTCVDTALCAYGQLALRTGTGLRGRQTNAPPGRDWAGLSQASHSHTAVRLFYGLLPTPSSTPWLSLAPGFQKPQGLQTGLGCSLPVWALFLQERSQGEEVKSRHRELKASGGGEAAVGRQHPSAWAMALEIQEQMVARGAPASLCHMLSCLSDPNTSNTVPTGSEGSPQEGGDSMLELGHRGSQYLKVPG